MLAGIAPPRLRRKAATIDTIAKAANNPNHLLYDCVTKQRKQPRLKSRKPFHGEVEALRLDAEEKHPGKKWLRDRWQSEWQNNSSRLRAFLPEAGKCSGTSPPRRCWVQLNRGRTGIGRTKKTLHRWKMTDSPDCARGVRQTLNH